MRRSAVDGGLGELPPAAGGDPKTPKEKIKKHIKYLYFLLFCALAAGCGEDAAEAEWDPRVFEGPASCPAGPGGYGASVVSLRRGEGGMYGEPAQALGAPVGGAPGEGSLDVLSLGWGGEVVVALEREVVDCPGDDLAVLENAFAFGEVTYAELGEVSVSLDGARWFTFPCDPAAGWPWAGCAGVGEVWPAEEVEDATAPGAAGGDGFDLATVGVGRARYVRVRDLRTSNGPSGPPSRGFDLDAVVIYAGHGEAAP